jgi:hypothetical protein
MKLLICVVLSYLVASAWELIGHRSILHANKEQASQWQRYGVIGKAMREARFNHLIHHHLSKSNSWTRARIQASLGLSESTISQLEETKFGVLIKPTLGSIILFSGLPLLVTIPCFLVLCPAWLPLGAIIAMSPFLMTRYVHPVLHEDNEVSAARWVRLLHPAIQPAVEYLRAYHAEHHSHPYRNYNLLLGAEHILSISAKLVRR